MKFLEFILSHMICRSESRGAAKYMEEIINKALWHYFNRMLCSSLFFLYFCNLPDPSLICILLMYYLYTLISCHDIPWGYKFSLRFIFARPKNLHFARINCRELNLLQIFARIYFRETEKKSSKSRMNKHFTRERNHCIP